MTNKSDLDRDIEGDYIGGVVDDKQQAMVDAVVGGDGIKVKYITQDSGKRKEFSTGMQRDTAEGKARYDLCLPKGITNPLLKRWAELMARGAEKYTERNWEKASTQEELDRFRESAFRHMVQWIIGEDDGEDHAAAVVFNLQGAEFVMEKMRCPTM